MGGSMGTVSARTKTELKRKAQQWIREAKSAGLNDIRRGWDPERVVKTDNGYEISLWAHT